MQDNKIKAFRQRLIRAGFKDIHIFCYKHCVCLDCFSPRGEEIHRILVLKDLPYLPVVKIYI